MITILRIHAVLRSVFEGGVLELQLEMAVKRGQP